MECKNRGDINSIFEKEIERQEKKYQRDLSFWKYKTDTVQNDEAVYNKLIAGIKVDEVEQLPVKNILLNIKDVFGEWNWTSQTTLEKDEQMIEIFMTEQIVRFDCYSVTNENMNLIIDIMNKYGCPLYDSSISIRFEL